MPVRQSTSRPATMDRHHSQHSSRCRAPQRPSSSAVAEAPPQETHYRRGRSAQTAAHAAHPQQIPPASSGSGHLTSPDESGSHPSTSSTSHESALQRSSHQPASLRPPPTCTSAPYKQESRQRSDHALPSAAGPEK